MIVRQRTVLTYIFEGQEVVLVTGVCSKCFCLQFVDVSEKKLIIKYTTNDNFYFVLCYLVPIIYTQYWYLYWYLDH